MGARVNINRGRGCYVGSVEVETGAFPGKLVAVAKGMSRAQALRRAASLAERIAQDPVMQAIMPANAMSAIQTAKSLAAAAQDGPRTLAAYLDGVHTPAAARLATLLAVETAKKAQREVMPEEEDEEDVGAWWNPITHTKMTLKLAKKLSPTHQLLKRAVPAMRKRARRGGADNGDDYEEGDDDANAEDVGFLPIAVLAAKYGPTAAAYAKKLYLKRQAAKAKAKADRAAREAKEAADEKTQAEAESMEANASPADDGGGDQ